MRVLHIPCYSMADPLPALEEHVGELDGYSSIGLVGTAQHLNRLDDIKSFLESGGKRVEVGGQVLGCRQDNALNLDVECILYVGSGRFHPLGIALKTDRQVFILNPLSGVLDRISEEEKKKVLGRRKAALKRALESNVFGILVSTKSGQYDLDKALELRKKLKYTGREAYLIAGDELTPPNLLSFKVDCMVNTACPRIREDEYHRPVVNAADLEEFLRYM